MAAQNPFPIFDLKLVITPPLELLCMHSFLTDNLKRVYVCLYNVPASSVEVIVGAETDRVPTMNQWGSDEKMVMLPPLI